VAISETYVLNNSGVCDMSVGPHRDRPVVNVKPVTVAYPGILFGRGGSTNSVEDRGERETGSGDTSPLVRGSGGSCNLVQEISF